MKHNNHTIRATHTVQKITALKVGPIPSAEELARYEAIHPGFAERIISMAEKQSVHRRTMEMKSLAEQLNHIRRRDIEAILGQMLAFIITLAALAGGFFAAMHDHPFFGAGISFSAIGAIVWCFIKGRKVP